MTPIPDHLQPHLDRELDEGEGVLWVGQPIESLLLKPAKSGSFAIVILFGLLGASMFLIGLLRLKGVLPPVNQNEVDFWGMMFVSPLPIFFGLLIRWFWLRSVRWQARNTIYAITNSRAIVIFIDKEGTCTERDYRGDELIHLARKENPDGTGTLTFESARGAGASSGTAFRHRFQCIENVIEVERLLRKQFGDA